MIVSKTQFLLVAFTILVLVCLVMVSKPHISQHAYPFRVTTLQGEELGVGELRLPFQLGSDGKGTATWRFRSSRSFCTNKYWVSVKACLVVGRWAATAECKRSRFTVDFNTGIADANAVVLWDLAKDTSGTVYYADYSGGHACALFLIREGTPNNKPAGQSK
jgi:hypothetical protein